MYLTRLDHEGQTWKVDLQALPGEEMAEVLEFSFFRNAAGAAPERLTWRVSGESLDGLSGPRMQISEELLRRQLELGLRGAEAAQ